jgi:hypothetical protein
MILDCVSTAGKRYYRVTYLLLVREGLKYSKVSLYNYEETQN